VEEHIQTTNPQSPKPQPALSYTRFTFGILWPIALVDLALIGSMLAVYAALGKLAPAAWLGAALGFAVSLLDFIVMVISLLNAEKKENTTAAQLSVRVLYIVRMLGIIALLVLALKSGYFNPLATVLPLCFMRIAVKLSEFIRRKRGNPA
jgi:uncharacterized membrane protein